jgi:hypothetical protein
VAAAAAAANADAGAKQPPHHHACTRGIHGWSLAAARWLHHCSSRSVRATAESRVPGCTAGIKRLDMLPPGSDGRKAWEASSVQSPDGEVLPLNSAIVSGKPLTRPCLHRHAVEAWSGCPALSCPAHPRPNCTAHPRTPVP